MMLAIDRKQERLAGIGESEGGERLYFSIVRVVPDPIKDEAVNVGVVVTRAEGNGGVLRTQTKRGAGAKIRALQRDFDFDALDWWLDDLRGALGLNEQLELGVSGARRASAALLADVQGRLTNQLQLTEPQRYVARDLDTAAERLLARYVTSRKVGRTEQTRLTHAELRERIWRVVSKWASPNVKVGQGGYLRGERAMHPADVVISNGHPRAALFALPIHHDQTITFLYRDSLPTIADDMGDDFKVFAVLPSLADDVEAAERQFADETRALLQAHARVETVGLEDLARVRDEVERTLV